MSKTIDILLRINEANLKVLTAKTHAEALAIGKLYGCALYRAGDTWGLFLFKDKKAILPEQRAWDEVPNALHPPKAYTVTLDVVELRETLDK